MPSEPFRKDHTPQQRAYPLLPHIDPGFVNHRLVQSFVGKEGIEAINGIISKIPTGTPSWVKQVQIDHAYTRVALALCEHLKVRSLGETICSGDLAPGQIVCSTEMLEGNQDVFHEERAVLRWAPHFEVPWEVIFELSTAHIYSDTCRSDLSQRSLLSFIAHLHRTEDSRVFFAPMVIGRPWLTEPPGGAPFDTMWLHYDFFEHYVEDIDEFQKVREVADDLDWSSMEHIKEAAFKKCLCEMLGDLVQKDWGGETSDHFSSHLHLQGRRLTAAFLLKGPGAGFSQMEMTHLGKRGDQLYRLACEPAEMLIVQHCHNIGPTVRATLRAFAVQPSRARRYCLMDGRDSFRLLAAYGLLEKALGLSSKEE